MSISRTTLRDIREALARLDKERETLTVRLSEIDKQADALRVSHDYLTRLHEEAQTDVGGSAVPAKNLRNEMVQILRDAAQPLHYTELRNRLESRDVAINGVDKAKTVGAHLSNDTRFKKLGRGMWALASWPASVATLDETGRIEDAPEEPDDPGSVFDEFPPKDDPIEPDDAPRDRSSQQRSPQPEREETFAAEDFDDVPF